MWGFDQIFTGWKPIKI